MAAGCDPDGTGNAGDIFRPQMASHDGMLSWNCSCLQLRGNLLFPAQEYKIKEKT